MDNGATDLGSAGHPLWSVNVRFHFIFGKKVEAGRKGKRPSMAVEQICWPPNLRELFAKVRHQAYDLKLCD